MTVQIVDELRNYNRYLGALLLPFDVCFEDDEEF